MTATTKAWMAAALLSLATPAFPAQGDRPLLRPAFVLERTDMVNAGVANIGAPAANEGGRGEIVLEGVSGKVTRALLYWHGADLDWPHHGYTGGDNDYDEADIVFNDLPIQGERLGSRGYNNNWGAGTLLAPGKFSAALYRADVTALVDGDGTYALDGLADGAGHSANGASLIVYFDDGDPGNDLRVEHYEAMDSNIDASFAFHWLARLPLDYTGGRAELWLHVTDGQVAQADGTYRIRVFPGIQPGESTDFAFDTPYLGQALWGGESVPRMSAPRPGSGPGLWDIRRFDITPALQRPGPYFAFAWYGNDGNDYLTMIVLQLVQSAPGQPPAITPPQHAFGDHAQGVPSPAQVFTFHNRQSDAIEVTSVTRGNASFTLTADDCSALTLAPGESCTVAVTCTPANAARDYRSALTFNWLDGFGIARRSGAIMRCSGLASGAHGRIAVDPPEAWLGAVLPGGSSPPTRLTVSSIGNSPVTMTSAQLQGPYRFEFAIVANGCHGMTLQPGDTCPIDVVYRPRPDRTTTPMPVELVIEFSTSGILHPLPAVQLGATVAPAPDLIFQDGLEQP